MSMRVDGPEFIIAGQDSTYVVAKVYQRRSQISWFSVAPFRRKKFSLI